MKTIEEIREFFAKDRYACGLTGAFIEEVAPGYAKLSLKIEYKHLNGSGHVMGGVYYTLADLAAAVDQVLKGSELCETHGASCVELLGGDAYLCAEAELSAVCEAGGGIDVYCRRIDFLLELLCAGKG